MIAWWGRRQSLSFKGPLHKTIIKHREKMSNFTVEKHGRHHLNQVIKLTYTVMGHNENRVSPDKIQREDTA